MPVNGSINLAQLASKVGAEQALLGEKALEANEMESETS